MHIKNLEMSIIRVDISLIMERYIFETLSFSY